MNVSQDQIVLFFALLGSLVTVVANATSFFKPFIEEMPFARPGKPLHDSCIQLFSGVLSLAGTLGAAYMTHTLSVEMIPVYLAAVGGGVGAAILTYNNLTTKGNSIGADAGTAASSEAVATAALAGVGV